MSKHIYTYRSKAERVTRTKRSTRYEPKWSAGLLWNPHAWWIGAHYSPQNKRHCINLVPCLTVWVRLPGGKEP